MLGALALEQPASSAWKDDMPPGADPASTTPRVAVFTRSSRAVFSALALGLGFEAHHIHDDAEFALILFARRERFVEREFHRDRVILQR